MHLIIFQLHLTLIVLNKETMQLVRHILWPHPPPPCPTWTVTTEAAGGEGGGLLDINEQQTQAVLAGELAAWAGAFEGGAGQVGGDLVGSLAAALHRPPQTLRARAQDGPFARRGELTARFRRAGIGRQTHCRFQGPSHFESL